MGKVFRIILILVTIVLSFHSRSFGDQLEKGTPPTNFSQELIYSQRIMQQKGELPFSSPEKAGPENTLYGDRPIKAIRDQEFSMTVEITNTRQSPAITVVQKKELSHFENGQLFKEKSSYHFGKIHLTGNNPDSSLTFISSLSVAKYKEENNLSWAPERVKEDDIFKSLAILLELKLNF